MISEYDIEIPELTYIELARVRNQISPDPTTVTIFNKAGSPYDKVRKLDRPR